MKRRFNVPLDEIRIASPCEARWDDMVGDNKVRFCTYCEKNVYNIAAMKRAEAMNLIEEHEGKLCARLFRRSDGTVLTQDCPVGLRKIVRKVVWKTTAFAAALVGILVTPLFFKRVPVPPATMGQIAISPYQQQGEIMGKVAPSIVDETREQFEVLGGLKYIE